MKTKTNGKTTVLRALVVLIVMLLTSATTCIWGGNKWYVDSGAVSGGDGKSEETPFKKLSDAISNAENGDIIMIKAGTYTGVGNMEVIIDKMVSFEKYGKGEVIFDALGGGRIWTVSASQVEIDGFIFKNASATETSDGSAIYVSDSYCTIKNCKFLYNSGKNGGAICVSGKSCIIINCTFISNTEGQDQYAIGYSDPNAAAGVAENGGGVNEQVATVSGPEMQPVTLISFFADPKIITCGSKTTLSCNYTVNGSTVSTPLPAKDITLSASGGTLDATSGTVDNGAFSTGFSANEPGEYEIIATVDNQELKTTVTVTKIPTTISVEKTSLDLTVNEDVSTGATLTPADAGSLTYTSSNEDVAIVRNGKILAVGEGTAIITVSFAGDNKYVAAESKTIDVTAILNESSVSVDNDDLKLWIGETCSIAASSNPEGMEIKYTTDDDDIIELDESGNITALAEGEAQIVVSVGGDGLYEKHEVNVKVTVTPKTVSSSSITLSETYYFYDGTAKKPTVTVKDGDTVISSDEYTVGYEDNTEIGTATVTITDNPGGACIVSGSTTFEIALKGDANGDKKVDAADIVEMVNAKPNTPSAKFVLKNADIDGSGDITDSDIDEVVNLIMKMSE